MPEMEPGKAPESKRSRKPAHPVKREVNQEMKSFAESTMNELLGWYGYEKVELREAEGSEVGSCPVRGHRQHVSVLKENSVTKPKAVESRVLSSSLAVKNGERDACGVPVSSSSLSSFSPSVKEQHSTHVIVPLIKPSAVEERQMQIVCVWCQKEGLKRYSLIMGSELKSFCSEKCFAACRRAYFKRNKAKGEDRHGDQSPTPGQTVDTPPRLVLKMSSNVRACDWCKHVHQTKEYLDFSSGEERLQFCSSKCLNRYKMDVFYREARAALTTSSAAGSSPGRGEEGDARAEVGEPARSGQMLLTPESWDGATTDGGHKGQTGKTRSACQSPPIINAGSSSSAPSAAKVVVPAPRPKERSGHPPPTESLFSAPPPHPVDYQHRPPPPPPIPPPFIRPPLQAQGLRSPTSGMPRNPAPPPPPSPTANPLFHHPTYPAPYLPYPPPYPHPLPHLGLGMPVFGPPCPQSTLLVPYPIIVPLPVPVPVPIPILLPPRDINPSSGPAGVVHHHDDREEEAEEESGSQTEETSETDIDTSLQRIKTERTLTPPVSSTHCPGRDLSPGMERESPILRGPVSEHRDGGRERQVIQRVVHGQAVKEETATQGGVHTLGQRDAGTNPEEPEGQTSPLSSSHPTTQTSSSSLHTPLLSTHSSTANLSQTTVLLPTHTAAESKNTHSAIVLHQTSSHCTGSATCVVGPTVSTLLDNRTVTPSAPLSLDNLHANQATSLPFGNQSGATPPLDSGGEPSPKLDPPSDSSLSESEDGRENDCQETSQLDRTDSRTDQSNESGGGLEEDEMLAADEEHTYARIVLRKSQEADSDTQAKPAAYTHAASHARPHDTEKHDGDAEPAAKRRCLRIREQNK